MVGKKRRKSELYQQRGVYLSKGKEYPNYSKNSEKGKEKKINKEKEKTNTLPPIHISRLIPNQIKGFLLSPLPSQPFLSPSLLLRQKGETQISLSPLSLSLEYTYFICIYR